MKKTLKEGPTLQEIEEFGKRHQFKITAIACFVLATIFIHFFFGAPWGIFLVGVGTILGLLLPQKICNAKVSLFLFIFRQNKTAQISFIVAALIVAIFLPLIPFLLTGMVAGGAIDRGARKAENSCSEAPKEEKEVEVEVELPSDNQ